MKKATISGRTGYLLTVKAFKQKCNCGNFTDHDGLGYMIKNGEVIISPRKPNWSYWVKPSQCVDIPVDIEHVLWHKKL